MVRTLLLLQDREKRPTVASPRNEFLVTVVAFRASDLRGELYDISSSCEVNRWILRDGLETLGPARRPRESFYVVGLCVPGPEQ
jgi:hypothetical protein